MAEPGNNAVFLSYASQDAEAARRICDALRAAGVEVWFDQSELRGGDAWDAKIRKQIKECALFVPIISANTQARAEGYFRLEWKLADRRMDLIGKSKSFLLPLCIDDTSDAVADVPDSFLAVQWTRLPSEASPAAFVHRVQALVHGASEPAPPRPTTAPMSSAQAAPAPSLIKSIAVLAFANLSRDPENEYFSDGITEELLNVLAKVPELRVAARTSAFFFKGKSVPVRQIAHELGVSHIVEGSVRKSGNRVRITAQLIKASDGYHVWSDRFDRELTDVFALQDEIAGLIAQNLQLQLGAAARGMRKVNPEAHRLVLEGRHFIALRWEGFARAERVFSQAIALDGEFAPAHAGLAEVLALRALYEQEDGQRPVPAVLARAKAAAEHAIQFEPALAEPRAALALVLYLERRFEESDREFQATLQLNPNHGMAHHWHALLLATAGRFDLATAAIERAVSLDPLAHSSINPQVTLFYAARRYEESLALIERALEIGPKNLAYYHNLHALLLLALGRSEEALAVARLIRRLPVGPAAAPHWWADGDAIYILHQLGAKDEAQAYLGELQTRLPANSHLLGYALCAVGRIEEGLPLFQTVAPMCQFRLYFVPMLENLQGSPALHRLFAAIGSANEYDNARTTLARLRAGHSAKQLGSANATATPSPAAGDLS